MGQRLNIEIKNKGKVLANSYYHWSAYSESALKLTKKIIDNFDEIQEDNEIIRAVRLLGLTGAGLTRTAIHYAYKNIDNFDLTLDDGKPFGKCLIPITTGRNDGLIAISEEEMKETETWEEGRITINIDTKTFDFDVLNKVVDDWWLDDLKEENILDKIPTYQISLKEIPFDEIDKLLSIVKELQDEHDGYFKINEDIYAIIY